MKEQAAFPAKNLKIRNQAKKELKPGKKASADFSFLCQSHDA